MILERLVIKNFRQFKGEQEIIFSDNRERNVTLVHAENGFGKTTLLNAILWALYGHKGLTPDFEGKDRLIHNGLAHANRERPSELEAMVHLTFTHDGTRYMLSRVITLADQMVDAKKDRLSLESVRDGQTFNLERAQHRIQAIVPEGIAKFLFFNGERIDELGLDKNRNQVADAIHQMLGLHLLQRTIDDLKHPNVLGRFRKELADKTSYEKRELLASVAKLEEKIASCTTRQKTAQDEIAAIDSHISSIDAKLAANKEAYDLQAKRKQLQHQREDAGLRLGDVNKRLAKLVAEDGYTLFTPDLVARGKSIMKELRERNMIPAPVIDSFLQQLLDESRCICERCLEPGSPEYQAVKKRLSDAPNQDFNNAVSALDHAIGILEGGGVNTRENLQQLAKERMELIGRIREIDGLLEDIHQKLGSKEDEEVKSLEDTRQSKRLRRDELTGCCGALRKEMEIATSEIEQLKAKIRKMEDIEGRAALAQRRVDAVEECIRVVNEILDAETQELLPLLNEEISKHFRKIIDRDYWAELTDNFELRIRHRIGDGDDVIEADVALSTGQRQVKLLVFIASLLALASRRSEIPTILKNLSGSEYPLVTDAPFGNISVFRSGISRWLSNLAPQVTILLTPGQYDGSVEKALKETGRVGKRYYLAYHGPENSLREGAEKFLKVEGKEYQQYFEADEEYTEIKAL
jgi:DNA sulfur modification protein DndD